MTTARAETGTLSARAVGVPAISHPSKEHPLLGIFKSTFTKCSSHTGRGSKGFRGRSRSVLMTVILPSSPLYRWETEAERLMARPTSQRGQE